MRTELMDTMFLDFIPLNYFKEQLENSRLSRILTRDSYAAYFKPLSFAGGDSYDIFRYDRNTLYLSISDVAGHNVESALKSSILQKQLSSLFSRGLSPEKIAMTLDSEFSSGINSSLVSFWVGKIDMKKYTLTYCSCGIPAPFLISKNTIKKLRENSPVLGISASWFISDTVSFKCNDKLFMYTDGLTDARKPDGNLLEDDLPSYLEKYSDYKPEEIIQNIRTDLAPLRIADDITMVCFSL